MDELKKEENKFLDIWNKIRKNVFFKILILFIACMLVTAVSFKYSVGKLGEEMFKSYFQNIYTIVLNFLPVFWLCMFIFAISNKVSISYLITAIVIHILTLANFFKMSLRDDNLLMEDLTLIREAMAIKTGYTFDISRGMIGFFVIFVVISIVMFFAFDKKKKDKEKVKCSINKKKLIARVVTSLMIFILGIVRIKHNLY